MRFLVGFAMIVLVAACASRTSPPPPPLITTAEIQARKDCSESPEGISCDCVLQKATEFVAELSMAKIQGGVVQADTPEIRASRIDIAWDMAVSACKSDSESADDRENQ